jgi:excisionase family DNA binding protein
VADQKVFDIDQLATYLQVPKSTLYRLAAEGKIPSHKVGRHWRFRRESVDRWLDQPEAPVAEASLAQVLGGEGE